MNDEEKIVIDSLMLINTIEEMEDFINSNVDIIFHYLMHNKSEDTKQQVIKKITNTISSHFSYCILAYIMNEIGNNNFAFDFLYEMYNTHHESFDRFFKECHNELSWFYYYFKNKKEYNGFFKNCSDEEKINFMSNIHRINEDDYQLFFSSNEELVAFMGRIPQTAAINIFSKLMLYQQKAIVMSDLDLELIISLVKEHFKQSVKSEENAELKDFIISSLIKICNSDNKIGLLMALNISDDARNHNINLINSKIANRAFMTDETANIFEHSNSKALTIAMPKSAIVFEENAVFFHELGHYLFKNCINNQVPKNFNQIAHSSQKSITENGIFGGKCLKLNDLFERTANLMKQLINKFDDSKIDEAFQQNVYQYIKNNLQRSIIGYMRNNGFDEQLIKNIENNFDNFDLNELTGLIAFDEMSYNIVKTATHLMGEHFMFEDLINAVFAGDTNAYIDAYRIDKITGHTQVYFQLQEHNQFNECIADFTSICLSGNEEILKFLKELIGEDLFNMLKDTYCSFALYGISQDDVELRNKIETNLFYDSGHTFSSIESTIHNMSQEEIIESINTTGEKLFVTPSSTSKNNEYYYSVDLSKNKVEQFINPPDYILPDKILIFRKTLYYNMTSSEKEEIMKLENIDLFTKQELILYDARAVFADNADDLSAIVKLIEKLFIINTDIIYVFHLIENMINLKKSNPKFSMYDAIYGEIYTANQGGAKNGR